jgi:pimeloyl-ACP methyl ester carboxylesterase
MHTTRRTTVVPAFTAFAALLAVLAAGQSPPFTTITGEVGPGALYEIAMPTAPWNGDLVVFAQGIGNPSDPITLPTLGLLRETLTRQGFAVVDSSRSVNGYGAVKDGMIRTHQLRGIFAETIGQPRRVYLIGRSLGGLISVMLAERFPGQYDGVLSGCGLLDGGAAELKYVADGRVLFDYFFPGVITASPFDVPPDDFSPGSPTFNAVKSALEQGLSSPDQLTLQFARTANLQASNAAEVVAAGLSVVGFTVIQANNLLDLTNSHMPYDNSKTWYAGSIDDDALNAGVARFFSDPSAVNYMEHYYTPSGELRIPVLTLHKARDPLVPIFHEEGYAEKVRGTGASQYLLQRTVDGFGHCGFLPAETAAFSALVQWVETGIKPQN